MYLPARWAARRGDSRRIEGTASPVGAIRSLTLDGQLAAMMRDLSNLRRRCRHCGAEYYERSFLAFETMLATWHGTDEHRRSGTGPSPPRRRHDALLYRESSELRAPAAAGLVPDAIEVRAHSGNGDEQRPSDLIVRVALSEQGKHLLLPRGEVHRGRCRERSTVLVLEQGRVLVGRVVQERSRHAPMRISSPGRNATAPPIRLPFTNVPLRLPRSEIRHPPSIGSSNACNREMLASPSRGIPTSSLRPKVRTASGSGNIRRPAALYPSRCAIAYASLHGAGTSGS